MEFLARNKILNPGMRCNSANVETLLIVTKDTLIHFSSQRISFLLMLQCNFFIRGTVFATLVIEIFVGVTKTNIIPMYHKFVRPTCVI